jgi:hypothetical protein
MEAVVGEIGGNLHVTTERAYRRARARTTRREIR